MNRRGFLKATGCSAISLWACSKSSFAANDSKKQILEGADERIETHRKANATLKITGPNGKPLPTGLIVTIQQKRHKFLFGCNIFKLNRCRTPEDNAAYEKQFASLMNFATLPFYWWNYERRQGEREDGRTEDTIRWCRTRNITTKGHPLAWNYRDPRWLPDEPDLAMQLQLKRISRCVRKFNGKIDIWDVVNEATHYNRESVKKQAPILTEAITKMGVETYIREAFRAARKANPNATLLINDYKTDKAFADKVISRLIDDNGWPLYDVIGIQSHMHRGAWSPQKTWQTCERFARFGKPLHFTETTLLSGEPGWELRQKRNDPDFRWISTPEGEKRQAKQVTEFYRILFSHPAVEAITWWDFSDQGAWQQAPAGLVRDDMTPKPAYHELKHLIKGRWWTTAGGTVDPLGDVRFRGFLGDYEVRVRLDGERVKGTFRLNKKTTEAIEVRLA